MRTAQAGKKPIEVAPRERILEAARQLFYSRGIRNVSVDEIAAAAETNKMTLYRHFESRDLLIAEYLKTLGEKVVAMHQELERALPAPRLNVDATQSWPPRAEYFRGRHHRWE